MKQFYHKFLLVYEQFESDIKHATGMSNKVEVCEGPVFSAPGVVSF